MNPPKPPDFASIANADTRTAFLGGHADAVEWVRPGTKLFKWTQSITTSRGVSPWWQFLLARRLANGVVCPGIREMQERANRLGVPDRDLARASVAVSRQFNKMTDPVAIELVFGAWGYIGKAAGQLRDQGVPGVFFIGGEYQVWVPGLTANDIRRISLLPYLQPSAPFGAR
jgi:hypothetical protein